MTASLGDRPVFVLTGGGARGAAHAGMLQVLCRHGIVPAALVAGSVGALNAAFIAQDYSIRGVNELTAGWGALREARPLSATRRHVVNNLVHRRPYLHSPQPLGELIDQWVSTRRLEDLPIETRIVTTNVDTGQAAYHHEGELRELLLASAAVPGLYPPVRLPDPRTGESAWHVDAGVSDLVGLAGAVDLNPTSVLLLEVHRRPTYPTFRNPLEVLVAALTVSTRLHASPDFGTDVPVVRIKVDDHIGGAGLLDFTQSHELIAAGAGAARAALLRHRNAVTPLLAGPALTVVEPPGVPLPPPA